MGPRLCNCIHDKEGGGLRPITLEKTISSYELEGKARTRLGILRWVHARNTVPFLGLNLFGGLNQNRPRLVFAKYIFTSILKVSDKFIEKCRRSRFFSE